MTENHAGKGGSYMRNPDGTLSLVERTLSIEEAAEIEVANAPAEPVTVETETDPPAPTGRQKK